MTIIPVYKKSAINCVPNYRLISLTSAVSNPMERVIVNQLNNYLISPHQFGFRRNSSTMHQLIGSNYDWIIQQNKGWATDVILLDYLRAFYSVVYSLSLVHMAYMVLYCFGLKTFSLIENIVYSLIVRSLTSLLSSATFPKVFDPVLFMINVNDLPLIVKKRIKTKLFAGDSKIYDEIESILNCLCIQESLNAVSN